MLHLFPGVTGCTRAGLAQQSRGRVFFFGIPGTEGGMIGLVVFFAFSIEQQALSEPREMINESVTYLH
jgi:hypothetical protein